MKRTLCFFTILVMLIFICTNVLSLSANTPGTGNSESVAMVSASSESQTETKEDSEIDTEGTGNSTGEIIFMLVIFLGSLLILAEAVVSTIRKSRRKKENIDPSNDERRR